MLQLPVFYSRSWSVYPVIVQQDQDHQDWAANWRHNLLSRSRAIEQRCFHDGTLLETHTRIPRCFTEKHHATDIYRTTEEWELLRYRFLEGAIHDCQGAGLPVCRAQLGFTLGEQSSFRHNIAIGMRIRDTRYRYLLQCKHKF